MLKLIFDYPSLFCDIPKIMRLRDDGLGDMLKFKTISLLSLELLFIILPRTLCVVFIKYDVKLTNALGQVVAVIKRVWINEFVADINYGIVLKKIYTRTIYKAA